MKKDSTSRSTKKSKEEEKAPPMLVRFNHFGGPRNHAVALGTHTPKVQAAKDGDVATRRAKKKHRPMYEWESRYRSRKKKKE